MTKNNMTIAEAYVTAIAEKNITEVEKYLHPDVTFSAPLAKVAGKEAYLKHTEFFMTLFDSYVVRACCGSGDQVMLVYDLGFPAPIGNVPTAGLLTFQAGLVRKIELFYDTRPFEQKP